MRVQNDQIRRFEVRRVEEAEARRKREILNLLCTAFPLAFPVLYFL